MLATKISSKIPFDDILNEVPESVYDNNLHRVHLLTKRDLFNIESWCNLTSSSVRHKNNAISVESWTEEMKEKCDSILYYKPQRTIDNNWEILKEQDFALMIMTPIQCEMLQKYGEDCICLDGTHGTNMYDFELITFLVVDDKRQGFRCAFLISNRTDKDIINIFFHKIKLRLGFGLHSNVFMSDMAPSFYNAWQETIFPTKFR